MAARNNTGHAALMRSLAERAGGTCVGDAVTRGVRKVIASVFFSQQTARGHLHVAYHLDQSGRLCGQYFRHEWQRDAWREALPLVRRPNRARSARAPRAERAQRGAAPSPEAVASAAAPVCERPPEAVAMHLPPLPLTQYTSARPSRVLPDVPVPMEEGYYMRQWRQLRGGRP